MPAIVTAGVKSWLTRHWPSLLILSAYALALIPLVAAHERWQDEAHAWLLARDAASVAELFHLLGYEGTPPLWYLLLRVLARANLPFYSISVLNTLVVLAALWIFLTSAPFGRMYKILFVFGYFPLYEYGVIARHYGLSLLLLCSVAAFYPHRFAKPVRYLSLLFLLGNTNIHSLTIAGALVGLYLWEGIREKQIRMPMRTCVALLAMGVGWGAVVYFLRAPADLSPDFASWTKHRAYVPTLYDNSLLKYVVDAIMIVLSKALVTIPRLDVQFWNFLLWYHGFRVVAVGVFLVSLVAFARRPKILIPYATICVALFTLFLFKYMGNTRHHGFIFLALILFSWLQTYYPIKPPPRASSWSVSRLHAGALTLVAVCHLGAAGIAAYYELRFPFSPGKAEAEFFRRQNWLQDDILIASAVDPQIAAFLAYLPGAGRSAFETPHRRMSTYVLWNMETYDQFRLPDEESLRRIKAYLEQADRSYRRIFFFSLNPFVIKPELLTRQHYYGVFGGNTIDRTRPLYLYEISFGEPAARFGEPEPSR